MPGVLAASPRLGLEIAGLSASDLLNHLVSIRFSDSLSRKGVIEATLADDGSLTFSPGTVLQIGIQVTLTCDHTAMATGPSSLWLRTSAPTRGPASASRPRRDERRSVRPPASS